MFKRFPFVNNHGDFVHLDALREWFRGVVSLETFLKSKDDKAIVKDMHFTDETTSVDYIDLKDDVEKSEVLCKYLTSDAFRLDDNTQFKKVDHIRYKVYPNQEKVITVRDKETGEFRDVIRSNCPIAYEATNDYMTSNKAVHIGIYDNGIKIYDDSFNKTSLLAKKDYQFCNPIAYNVTDNYKNAPKANYIGVNENGITIFNTDTQEVVQQYDFKSSTRASANMIEMPLSDCNPFGGCSNLANYAPINITKQTDFYATKLDDKVISGQIVYRFIDEISISAGESVTLQFTPATMGASNFSQNIYPKYARCHADNMDNNAGVISSIHYDVQGCFPTSSNLPIRLTVFNPTETDIRLDTVLFTF